MDDQAAEANRAELPGQGSAGPAHVPSQLVLVTPSETPGQAWAPSTSAPTTGRAPHSGQNPRERAAAAAAAAAADLQAGLAESTTPAPETSSPRQPAPPPAAAPHISVPAAADAAPVSRWAYAGMASTSAASTTTRTTPRTTRNSPATSPAARPTSTPTPSRATPAAAGNSRATRASAPSQHAERASFLRHTEVEAPARHGWRGALSRLGLKVAPSADERAERADIAAVAAHWAGHRTVAVVNGKGGSSKSPTTALLSAVFARHGGSGVLAWENNQTRGTLGWRTEQGPHDATLLDLMPAVPDLLGRRAGMGDFAAFTHHQILDRYAVLRAQPKSLADEQRISPDDVTAIHEVAAKFNRLIVIDSGNDESDPMWRRMVDHTDQLVVATTTRDDHAEVAALLLEGLARGDAHRTRLAAGAVVVVSQADRSATRADLDRVADGFADLARDVVTVRFDPAMVDGVLRWDTLHPTTQRDWLRAGAAVARGL